MHNLNLHTIKRTVIALLLVLGPLSLLADTTKTDTAAIIDPITTIQGFKKSEPSAMQKKYDDFILKDRMWVYNWQDISSVVIFIMVMTVVLMGLILSYKQFAFTNEMIRKHHDEVITAPQKTSATIVKATPAGTEVQQTNSDEQNTTTTVKIPAQGDIPQPATTFEVTKDGLKINSAVIGLIILVVSIVFFFLYLRFVYPIHEVRI